MTGPAVATAAGNMFVSNGANSLAQRIPASDTINTLETTTSTAYVNLTTAGPTAASVVSDIRVIVWWTVQSNTSAASTESISSVDVSGATTTAPSDNYCTDVQQGSGTSFVDITASRVVRLTVTAGTNTYQLKYKVAGTATGTFRRRTIVVLPF